MVVDLRSQRPRLDSPFDVCIVGAGAAGIAAAVDLARRGQRVALLESGGRHFELGAQALCAGEPSCFQGLYHGRGRNFGGTTTLWGGQILPIDPHVVQGRPVIGGAWPLQFEELADAYGHALGLEGLDRAPPSDGEIWRLIGQPPPDYGEAFEPAFSRWCPVRDFARLHADTLRDNPRLTVFLHATVTGVRFHDDGHAVQAVRISPQPGTTLELAARQFVMAVGGIETCRLLLQPDFSNGPAPWQRHGWVGKHFQDHISCTLATVRGERPRPAHFDYAAVHGLKYHPKIKLRSEWQRRLGTLDVCGTVALTRDGVDDLERAFETYRWWRTRQWRSITPARARHFIRHVPQLLWQRVPVGRPRVPADPLLRLCVHCEQAPDSPGRVVLSEQRDAYGLRQARVEWRFVPLELHSIRRFVETFDFALRQAGDGYLSVDAGIEDDGTLTGWFRESFHHLGGARMAQDPDQGVVDPQLRVHGTRNLWICSTAVFPSSGFANPTHTLIALASRLAAHLDRQSSASRSPVEIDTRPTPTAHARFA